MEDTEKRFVPLHKFSEMNESLKNQREDIKDIQKKLDRIIDRLYNGS